MEEITEQMGKEPKGNRDYQIYGIKEEVWWNWDFRQSSLILQISLYIVVNVCVFSLCFISSCQIVYNSRDKKISGQPLLSQFTSPNNGIKGTNQNELMRCCGLPCTFSETLSPLLSGGSDSLCQAAAWAPRDSLPPTVASAHPTLCFKGDQMAGLGRGSLKEKQGVQLKKINREEQETKAAAGGKRWAAGWRAAWDGNGEGPLLTRSVSASEVEGVWTRNLRHLCGQTLGHSSGLVLDSSS